MRLENILLLTAIAAIFHNINNVASANCNSKQRKETFFWVSGNGEILIETTKENVTKVCSDFTCITKCCRAGMFHFTSTKPLSRKLNCYNITDIRSFTNNQVDKVTKFDYSELKVYKLNSNNDLELSNLSITDFKVNFNHKFYRSIDKCTSGLHIPGEEPPPLLLLEDGSVTFEKPNRYIRYPTLSQKDACFEYLVEDYATDTTHDVKVMIHFLTFNHEQEENNDAHVIFKEAAFLISILFLLLVLIVYASLKELRGIGGMMQMAYCATYMLALIIIAVLLFTINKIAETDTCRYFTIVAYYLVFASFFWMNVMSFDIWWTFRGCYKQRKIHRQGELVKFGWYALYAWGTPLLVTIAVTVLDDSDLSNYPNIVKPFLQDCLKSTDEFTLYYNMPIGALLATNFVFFLLTAYNYWRIKKNLDKYQEVHTTSRMTRFMMYLKLAVIMGIGWIFDIITILPDWLKIVAAIYNSLIGVVIFLVFVFKKKILMRLSKKYGLHRRFEFIRSLERRWTTPSVPSRSQKKSIVESDITTRSEVQSDVP